MIEYYYFDWLIDWIL